MNPNDTIIIPKYTGHLSVRGVGRVGTYESAVRRHRSRARQHWVIEEELPEVKITTGVTDGRPWEARTKQEAREDLGHFKSKAAAIQFLTDYAKAHNLQMQGDISGYPWLVVPAEEAVGSGISREAYECLYLPRNYGAHTPGKLP